MRGPLLSYLPSSRFTNGFLSPSPKLLRGRSSELPSLFVYERFSVASPSRFLNEEPSELKGRFGLAELENDFLLLKSEEPPFEKVFLGPELSLLIILYLLQMYVKFSD